MRQNTQQEKQKNTLKELFQGISSRPALAAFFSVTSLIVSLNDPKYACAFGPFLVLMLVCIAPFARKISLLFILVMELLILGNVHTASTIDFSQIRPTSGEGDVEVVLPRPSGMAVVIQTDWGRIRLTYKKGKPPEPGDKIHWEAKWYPVNKLTVPGSFNTEAWLESQKLAAYGELTQFALEKSRWVPEKSFSAFRLWLKNRFAPRLSPAETGLLLGLLAGDRSGIPDALQNDFRRTGLVHVLSISGFHIVLLAGMLMLFLKATRLPHFWARIIAMILMLIYIPVTGASAAVSRSVFMFLVVQMGGLVQRKADNLNNLGVALLALLLFDPNTLWDAGFQLSAAATAGIIIGNDYYPFKNVPEYLRSHKLWKLIEEHLVQASWVTFVATLSTAPFLIYHFQSMSPVSWLGNILVVPLVALAMQAGLFTIISPVEFLQYSFADAAAFYLRLASLITQDLADSPSASMTVGPFDSWILCLVTLALIGSLLFFKNIWARWMVIGIATILSGFFLFTEVSHRIQQDWKFTVLDAGQGDCILVKSPNRHYFLIDAGVNKGKRNFADDKIIPFLRNQGILELKALIITHPDADHFGGASRLLKMFPVREVWTHECARIEAKPEWQVVLATASEKRIAIRDLHRGLVYKENFRFPGEESVFWEIRVLHPDPFVCGETNSESITLRIQGPGGSALFTGDLTVEGEKEILATDIPLQSDIIKLGHHGSKTSSSEAFLEKVHPKIALVSAGKNNRFKHPSKEIVERLKNHHIPMLNTANVGSITFEFEKDSLLFPKGTDTNSIASTLEKPRMTHEIFK